MVNWLLVILGAMIGAPLRYLADRAIQSRHDTAFPWGTFTVNVTGCLILGVLAGTFLHGAPAEPVRLLIGTGLCGALSTYSTFSYETVRLAETGAWFFAAVNTAASALAGLGAVVVGSVLAAALWF